MNDKNTYQEFTETKWWDNTSWIATISGTIVFLLLAIISLFISNLFDLFFPDLNFFETFLKIGGIALTTVGSVFMVSPAIYWTMFRIRESKTSRNLKQVNQNLREENQRLVKENENLRNGHYSGSRSNQEKFNSSSPYQDPLDE